MDVLYGTDQKLGDMEDSDMTDFLDSDMFNSSMTPDSYMDNEWLNCLFDDPVLNDKMITDAVQKPCIKSEHSYSLNDQNPGSPLGLPTIDDIEPDFLGNPNAMDLSQKSFAEDKSQQDVTIKQEPMDNDPLLTSSPKTTVASIPKQQTIIVTTSAQQILPQGPLYPTVTVKQEPPDTYENLEQIATMDQIVLPPTPPSSASSDSEGSQSPHRSAPSSPLHGDCLSHHSITSQTSKSFSQPLFVNPLPQSGVLILSEEEKRTLISEGYPIPAKLPLTKQEEKNLKKIRRKIKNKISAQESRRKKKEYLEALEKRVESFNQENCDLKKKIDSLESNNRSLLGQLHKLQALVAKMPRPSAASATQTGTVLMVLVLCFAVFLGSWCPTSLNIGYSSGTRGFTPVFMSKPDYIRPAPDHGPNVASAKVQADYTTPNMKSRVLLSLKDDLEDGPLSDDVRAFYPWDRSWCSQEEHYGEEWEIQATDKPAINNALADVETEVENDSNIIENEHNLSRSPDMPTLPVHSSVIKHSENDTQEYQATMHPDIAVTPIELQAMEHRKNFTAEIETA